MNRRVEMPLNARDLFYLYEPLLPRCLAQHTMWVCTRRRGHSGPHVAHLEDSTPIDAWTDVEPWLEMDEGL